MNALNKFSLYRDDQGAQLSSIRKIPITEALSPKIEGLIQIIFEPSNPLDMSSKVRNHTDSRLQHHQLLCLIS